MNIGLYDVDSHHFPNLALMKLSAYHKKHGDSVEFVIPIKQYDRIYISKIFGDEYSKLPDFCFQAKEVIYGGTGFAITVENGKEVYHKEKDIDLPNDVEHIYPDYTIYPDLTKDTAYGFLTRGCCNNCDFCIVSKKEGLCSLKVADLSEFWRGQKNICLMDANLLACKDRLDLLKQLSDSKAYVDFTQGLDARFMNLEVSHALSFVKKKTVHFAFDSMKNEQSIIRGLHNYRHFNKAANESVYILTNFNTTFDEDLYRICEVQNEGFLPDIRIYRKQTAPRFLIDLQRWCNNRILYRSTSFSEYIPRSDGLRIMDLYPEVLKFHI